MQIEVQDDHLAALIEHVIERVLARRQADEAKLEDRLCFTESEAAALLGVRPHVLRDARLRGEIDGARVGKKIMYAREELLAFLNRNRAKRAQ